jgi:hypothetical protein
MIFMFQTTYLFIVNRGESTHLRCIALNEAKCFKNFINSQSCKILMGSRPKPQVLSNIFKLFVTVETKGPVL